MTRRRLYFYHVCAAGGFCGMLLAINPPLAMVPIGFATVYLSGLLGLYVAGWVAGMSRRRMWARTAAAVLGCVALWLSMTAIDPGAGVFALLFSPISLWPRRPRAEPVAIAA